MLLLLSSGASLRYLPTDVLALPEGASVQYRYRQALLSDAAYQGIERGKLLNTSVLITYIEQTDNTRPLEFVPLRFGVILNAELHGTTTSILLKLGKRIYASDLDAFRNDLIRLCGDALPKRIEENVVGKYALEIADLPQALTQVAGLDSSQEALIVWERQIGQLMKRRDFSKTPFFYRFLGLYAVPANTPVSFTGGPADRLLSFEIKAGKEYELRFYVYSPVEGQKTASLECETTAGTVTFVTSPRIVIDSPYDLKRVRFFVDRAQSIQAVNIGVFAAKESESFREFEFDLVLRIKEGRTRKALEGIGVGLFLAAPSITAAWTSSTSKTPEKLVISAVAIISGLVVGLFATFHIKKGV